VLREGYVSMERGRREGLKLSLLDFLLCFGVFFLMFLDHYLRFRV
jgi:hypothetical protein